MPRRRRRKEQREVSTPSLTQPLLLETPRFEEAIHRALDPLSPSPDPLHDDIRRDPLGSLIDVEDRRLFNPDPVSEVYHTTLAQVADIQESVAPVRKGAPLGHMPRGVMSFVKPERVMVCVRRQQRREVLHAFRRVGRGTGRRRRRNDASNIRC